MAIILHCGSILDLNTEALVCSANTSLLLTGGVGADLVTRFGGNMQERLREKLVDRPQRMATRGDVFVDQDATLPYKAVLHAVAIDAFYETDVETVAGILMRCYDVCRVLEARTVALSALATGFGNLSLEEFAEALTSSLLAADGLQIVLAQPQKYCCDELAEALADNGIPVDR